MGSYTANSAIPTNLLCQDPSCPIANEAHHMGGYQTNPYDRAQRNQAEPPKAIIIALSNIEWHGEDNVSLDDLKLMEKWNAVHGGWMNVPVKKQKEQKGRGKKPERNWQAAMQNGPKPMVIGSGKKTESTSPVQAMAGKPNFVPDTEKENSVRNTPSSSKGKKIAWDEDV